MVLYQGGDGNRPSVVQTGNVNNPDAAQDFAATFVDFTPDFADLEVRREGDNSDNVELHQVLLPWLFL